MSNATDELAARFAEEALAWYCDALLRGAIGWRRVDDDSRRGEKKPLPRPGMSRGDLFARLAEAGCRTWTKSGDTFPYKVAHPSWPGVVLSLPAARHYAAEDLVHLRRLYRGKFHTRPPF